MLYFILQLTVYMPSVRIAGWLVTPRSPFPAGNLGIPEAQQSFECNMATQTGYSEHATTLFFFFFIPQQHKIYCTCTLFLHTRGTPGAPWSCQTCIGKCYPHRPAGHQLLHSLRKVEHRSAVPLCAQKGSSNLAADGNLPTSPSSRQLREKESQNSQCVTNSITTWQTINKTNNPIAPLKKQQKYCS